jgi:hypothetical protein
MQAGVRSSTLMTPQVAQELSIIGGTAATVLSNLGLRKLLFNFTSSPTDADGLATFPGLGFIRHGPAGMYTLTFACAGFFLGVETSPINVTSAVASVAVIAPTRASSDDTAAEAAFSGYNVSLCVFACRYALGAGYGSYIYADGAAELGLEGDALANLTRGGGLPSGPSGFLAPPPALAVYDAMGRPLAGKAASAVVFPSMRYFANTTQAQHDAALAVIVREYPGRGYSRSVLSADAVLPTDATDSGEFSCVACVQKQAPATMLLQKHCIIHCRFDTFLAT